jgi:hypothetical protein
MALTIARDVAKKDEAALVLFDGNEPEPAKKATAGHGRRDRSGHLRRRELTGVNWEPKLIPDPRFRADRTAALKSRVAQIQLCFSHPAIGSVASDVKRQMVWAYFWGLTGVVLHLMVRGNT